MQIDKISNAEAAEVIREKLNRNASKFAGLPDDFYIATGIDTSSLLYKTDIYRYIDLQPDTEITIHNTNEIVRNGNDLFLAGNFTFDSAYPTIVIGLYGCRIEDDILKYNSIVVVELPDIYQVHGLIYYREMLYMASRQDDGITSVKMAKINPYRLTDFKVYTLPDDPAYRSGAHTLCAYGDRIFMLINEDHFVNPRIVGVDLDLTQTTLVASPDWNPGSAWKPKQDPPFIIYNNEIFTYFMISTTKARVVAISMDGKTMRNSVDIDVFSNDELPGGTTGYPHWLNVFNGKLIFTMTYDKGIYRVDANTLEFEESLEMTSELTDDHTITQDGYIYFNGELNPWVPTVLPSLHKIKYNDFTDHVIEQFPFHINGKGSYGSIDRVPHSGAKESAFSQIERSNLAALVSDIASITDAASIAWNWKSKYTGLRTLTTARSAVTLTLSGVLQGATGVLSVIKNTASPVTITLAGTGLSFYGYNSAGYTAAPSIVLNGASGDIFDISFLARTATRIGVDVRSNGT